MLEATRIFYVVFAALTAAGGFFGYARVGSKASLLAGIASAVLLGVAAFLLGSHVNYGRFVGLIVSLLLAGKFVPDALHGGRFIPTGLMAILSAISVTLTLLSWYGQ